MWERYINDGVLALDSNTQMVLGDLDVKVTRLEVARNLSSEIDILDSLRPLVGELALLLGLASGGELVGGLALGWSG